MKQLAKALYKETEVWNHTIIESKEMLRDWLVYEAEKYSGKTMLGGVIPSTEQDFIWNYQKRLRYTEYYLNTRKRLRYLVSRVVLNRLGAKYGPNIRLNSCGRGLYIAHLGNIITNGDIGCDCKIAQNVTIGHNHGEVPTIGNHVSIYTGTTVIGHINIADGVVIGANSLVNKSFDKKESVIAGVPAHIIKRDLEK